MSLSASSSSSSSSSVEDESGILDDLIGTDIDRKAGNPDNKQTEHTRSRQRGRGSSTGMKRPKFNKRNDDSHKLFEKRLYTYPTASSSSLQQPATTTSQPKTEVEMAVLTDCINNHFLLASNSATVAKNSDNDKDESSVLMVGALISRFEKITLRKNEIIFEEGDDADYLYVLYRGEVLVRSLEDDTRTSLSHQEEKEEHDDDDNDDADSNNKYTILGELELLTNSSSYKATAKATSDSCLLFRLGTNDFQSYFLPQRQQQILEPSRLSSPSQQSSTSTSTAAEEQKQLEEEERLLGLLRKALPSELSAYFFPDDDEDYDHHIQLWKRLLSERKVRYFRKGDVLIHKSKPVNALVMITDGLVRASDNTAGGQSYEDLWIGQGSVRTSFGWQSVLKMATSSTNNKTSSSTNNVSVVPTGTSGSSKATISQNIEQQDPTMNSSIMTGTIRAETDGQAIVISKKSFEKVFCHLCYNHEQHNRHSHHDSRSLLMDVADLRWRRWKRTQLQQIMVFKDSRLDTTQINGLLDLMHHCEYSQEETILQAGQKVEAAMYFVREGSVRLELSRGRDKRMIERGGYFGEKNMLLDQNTGDNQKHHQKRSVMTAISSSALTKVDVLYLEECRKVVNTTILGLGMNATVNTIDESVQWVDLKRHKLLGTGSFGQVWLASTETSTSTSTSTESRVDGEGVATNGTKRRVFALKVQAKYPLLRSGNAERLIAERNVMASLDSPFIMRLFNAFQDDYRLYMVTSLLPGGELESAIPDNGFSENTARFYAVGILEALTYMHRKHIIHRDVKPENVLLNFKGYPVLIDLGFAKYVPDKTFTFCGSPMFMAPETILYKGQNKGVDHWSWAVLLYRMVTGKYPFYQKGMDEMALYKRICKGAFEVTGTMSIEFRMLMIAILYPDPTQRLGSRANGWRDIYDAPWLLANALSSSDLRKLRKQTFPAPWVPSGAAKTDQLKHDSESSSSSSLIHQSSDDFEDLFNDDICGKIADDQQHIFSSFGSQVSSPIGDPTI